MDDGEGGGVDPLVLQRRAEIRDAYARLLTEQPALQGSLFFVIKGETSLEKTQLLADFIKN